MYVNELIEILEECDPDSEVVLVIGWTPADGDPSKSDQWTHSMTLRRVEVREDAHRELSDTEFNELADQTAESWGVDAADVIDERIRRAACGVTTGLIAGQQKRQVEGSLMIVRGW